MNIKVKIFSTLNFLRPSLTAFVTFLFGLILSGFWAAYFFPPVIAWTENKIGRALDYEMNARFYLAGMLLIIIIFYLLYSLIKKNYLHRFLALLLLAAYAILPIIFIFDTRHSLIEEMSWIRYPSSLVLLLAGLIFFFISRRFNQGEKWPAKNERVWLILSAGLIFAGVDEIAEIHEKIGYVLEKFLSLAHVTSDLITVFYFLAGLAVLIWLLPAILKTAREKGGSFGQIGLFAILLFGLAAFFDTFDKIILNQIQHLTDYLANRGFLFSDAWYIIYEPKRFLNGLEEIFEYLSGVLFFGAGLIFLLKPEGAWESSVSFRRKKIMAGLGTIFALLLLLPLFLFRPIDKRSPLQSNEEVWRVASLEEGLFHSDDLDFHPEWGIALANESEPKRRGKLSGPGVFVFKDGNFKKLPDPQKLLADIDSVTADKSGIFAADGARGKIFRYQNAEKGFEEIASRKNGLKTPEGLIDLKGELFILDENEKTVSRLDPKYQLTIDYPRHPLWQSPEGIIYHPLLKAFLITDDKTGAIFKYNFGQKIEVWADKKTGLKSPEDLTVAPNGDVLVTDNGRGEVVIFSQDGKIKKTLRFRPLFRDLQGITLDDQDNLYVVTADSYGSASFMPSYLWKIYATNMAEN